MKHKWCFPCQGYYRGSYPMHQGTVRHRQKTAPKKHARRDPPPWAYGARHDPTEEDDRQWLVDNAQRDIDEYIV